MWRDNLRRQIRKEKKQIPKMVEKRSFQILEMLPTNAGDQRISVERRRRQGFPTISLRGMME
jgi:hypothetical protein